MPDVSVKTLRDLRQEAGLTLVQVAEKLHCQESTVSNWECGRGGMRPKYFPLLARLYRCSRADVRLALAKSRSKTAAA